MGVFGQSAERKGEEIVKVLSALGEVGYKKVRIVEYEGGFFDYEKDPFEGVQADRVYLREVLKTTEEKKCTKIK